MQDLIIDCFAGGGGASVGIELALGRPVDIAINHDPQAIKMHKVNHPDTLHLTEDIFQVDLKKYVGNRHVALMWASPDCTSHSKAKGGKPREKGLRILPWAVYKHAKAILPDVIIMENVEEIQDWGPLDDAGRPINERKGEDYKKFIKAMQSLDYDFDCRVLVAADYGAPTTRKRWYAIFRRDGRPIVWPEPTHSKGGTAGLKPWKPIYKYLDLNDYGKSIFGRNKPLAKNTMQRIARGLEKFIFNCPEPFIVQVNHAGDTFRGQGIYDPLPTITSKHGFGIVTPMIIQYHSETANGEVRGQAVTEPIKTIDTSNRYGLVISYITKLKKTGACSKEPIYTITTSPGHFGKVSVMAVPVDELMDSLNGTDSKDATNILQKCTWVSQFIMEYYGTGIGQSLNDPLHTVVSKDRFALVTVIGNEYVIMDIFLRMLTPKELMLGQGFPEDYIIDRDSSWRPYPLSEQVARIGNSVVPVMAQALVNANCPYLKVGERAPAPMIYMQKSGQVAFA